MAFEILADLYIVLYCINSILGIQTNNSKDKINNKHTQRTQEFLWFNNLPTSTGGDREKVSYKIGRLQLWHKDSLKKPKP